LLLNDFDQHKKKLLKQQLKEAVQKGVWTEWDLPNYGKL
jgi:hypothetical protein